MAALACGWVTAWASRSIDFTEAGALFFGLGVGAIAGVGTSLVGRVRQRRAGVAFGLEHQVARPGPHGVPVGTVVIPFAWSSTKRRDEPSMKWVACRAKDDGRIVDTPTDRLTRVADPHS